MASTGFVVAGGNNDDNGTENPWLNPANAQVATDAAFSNPQSSGTNAAWFWHTFDFAGAGLLSTDTVTGIEFRLRLADGYNDETWHILVGHDATTDVVADYTTNRLPPVSGNAYTGSTPSNFDIGGSSDLLGYTGLTATNLLAASYRVMVQLAGSGDHPEDAELYTIWANVHYTRAGGGSVPAISSTIARKRKS